MSRNKPRPKASNPFSGIRNLYSNADGLMHNQIADNVVAASVQQREGKARRAQLRYGKPQNGRHIKVVHYKDENGNARKRVIVIGSTVECTECDLDSDKTMAAQLDTGEVVTTEQVEEMGCNWSGYLMSQKAYFREMSEMDEMVNSSK
ncbi:MAG: hypothetical protein A3F80_03005 [Candidatus Melainabacteria bacterium RIFCSPLOWO2_12_FULL_35_11]|nr:MAG: hypothetical protein A3F80_03005 [Candidatus Melainabacteria bacterium RIFCSPLOWO2_12_FULL_35_11]